MSTSFLVLRNIYNDIIRLNVDHIISYSEIGDYCDIITTTGSIQAQVNASDLDRVLSELHFMFKEVVRDTCISE